MPNRDGGHYFLTVLSPVLTQPCQRADGSYASPAALLRETLATLPPAAQNRVCAASGRSSPFERCQRTHLARFVVIDQPAFNGRTERDTLIDTIYSTRLQVPQPVDTLTRSWLLFAADVDPADGPDEGLTGYLTGLWAVMADELRAIYRHCARFDEEVRDGADFARYIKRCQIETVMPFNDYWITPPKLPTLPVKAMIALAAAFLIAAVWIASHFAGLIGGVIAVPVAIAIVAWAAYRFVLARGAKPFPVAPGSDLPTILKALFLQQQFARFAIAQQGASPAALKTAFDAFVAANRPHDLAQPTQAPGVISS